MQKLSIALLLTILSLGIAPSFGEQIDFKTYQSSQKPLSERYSLKLAQNSDCDLARTNAEKCYRAWQSMGGGDSGQAATFQQCLQQYCILLVSHDCNKPTYCD